MARIASEEKGGYYPTPPTQVKLVASRLRAEEGARLHLFDPCAGEGDALRDFAEALKKQGAEVVTYGIELEKERAAKAKQKLDHVLPAPYEDTRVTPHSMSFLWLNPPYNDRGGERAEVTFLRDLTDANGRLQPGGLLGFCIPRYVLRYAAMLLAIRFENIHVYRFTDPEYGVYNQIVVFGYRRKKSNDCPDDEKKRLEAMVWGYIPLLNDRDGITFTIPPAAREVTTFQANILETDEIKAAIQESPLWEVVRRYDPLPHQLLKQPVLPLKPTHIAVAIAAGAVGGNMGSHLLVGATKKVVSHSEVNDGKTTKIIETTESRSVVRIFAEDGIHILE